MADLFDEFGVDPGAAGNAAPKDLFDEFGVDPARASESTGKGDLFDEFGVDPQAGRLKTSAGQAVRGLGDVVSAFPKAAAVEGSIARHVPRARELMQRADKGDESVAGELMELSQKSTLVRRLVEDWQRARSRGYGELDHPEAVKLVPNPLDRARERVDFFAEQADPRKSPMYQRGREIDAYMSRLIGVNPAYQNEFWAGDVSRAFGNMLGFAVIGAATGGYGVAISGRQMGIAGGFEDALNKGASFEDALKTSQLSGAVGLTEAVPIARMLDRLDKGSGGLIRRAIVNAMKTGTEEAIQEAGSTIMQNIIASDIVKYDPQRGVFQGAGRAGAVGGTTGGLIGFLATVIGGRRGRTAPAQQPPVVELPPDQSVATEAPQIPAPQETAVSPITPAPTAPGALVAPQPVPAGTTERPSGTQEVPAPPGPSPAPLGALPEPSQAAPVLSEEATALFADPVETGISFDDLVQVAGSEGDAVQTANSVAAINAALDAVPMGRMFKRSPGLRRLFLEEYTTNLASNPELRSLSATPEGMQQIIETVGANVYVKHPDLFPDVPEAMFRGALRPETAVEPSVESIPPGTSEAAEASLVTEPPPEGGGSVSAPDFVGTFPRPTEAALRELSPDAYPDPDDVQAVSTWHQEVLRELVERDKAIDLGKQRLRRTLKKEKRKAIETEISRLTSERENILGEYASIYGEDAATQFGSRAGERALSEMAKEAGQELARQDMEKFKAEQAERERILAGKQETAKQGPTLSEIEKLDQQIAAQGFVPKEGWESNLFKAREYAAALGIPVKGKRREQLVAEIQTKVGSTATQQNSEPRAAAPVAESQAPAPEAGEGAVARTPAGSVPSQVVDEAANEAATSPDNNIQEPSQDQKAAGNYKKGHLSLHGLNITIENPRGSYRFKLDTDAVQKVIERAIPIVKKHINRALKRLEDSGTIPEAFHALNEARKHANLNRQFITAHDLKAILDRSWYNRMAHHYGYIRRTEGRDGDSVDVFLGPQAEDATLPVFVVDQIDPQTGKFDEHKVMMGFPDEATARAGYLANYSADWRGLGAIRQLTLEEFKTWLKEDDTTRRTTKENEDQPAAEAIDPIARLRDAAKADVLRALAGVEQVQAIAVANTAEKFAAGVEKYIKETVADQLKDAHTPAARRALEELLEGDKLNAEVFDEAFYGVLHAEALKQARRAERERLKAEWAEQLAAQFAQAAQANGIADLDSDAGREFRTGWEHAIDGKTKSTLPGGAEVASGYEAARKWLETEEGAQFAKGARGKKIRGTGEQLRRIQDGWKKLTADIDAITGEDLKAAIASIFKATTRADVFRVAIPDEATPGLRRYVELVRQYIAPFKEWVTHTDRIGKDFYGSRNNEQRIAKYVDSTDALNELKAWAKEYNAAVESIAEAISGAKTIDQAVSAFSSVGATVKNSVMHYRYPRLANPDHWEIKNLKSAENEPDAAQAGRHRPLMRPRFDRVERDGRPDYRKGRNITPQELKEEFGFADVTIGEWVTSKQAQDHLNYAFDAFHDLADTLGIKPKDISLGGKLYVAFGALGRGRHAAHYQRAHPHPTKGDVPVINLTNTRGDGTVAHEWMHALDFALRERHLSSRLTDQMARGVQQVLMGLKYAPWAADHLKRYIDNTRWTRMGHGSTRIDHMRYSVQRLRVSIKRLLNGQEPETWARAVNQTDYKREADKLGEDYWGNKEELFARAGEAYVYDRIKGEDTYLVNDWVAEGKVTRNTGYRGTPYAAGDERQTFNENFDHFFEALTWDEQGPRLPDDYKSPFVERIEELSKALDEYEMQMPQSMAELNEREAAKKAEAAAKVEADRLAKLKAEYEQTIGAVDAGAQIQSMTTDEIDALVDEVAAQMDETRQEPKAAPPQDGGAKLMRMIFARLEKGGDIRWQDLFKDADEAFGGTQAQGAYAPKTAYDAMEAAVNEFIWRNLSADPSRASVQDASRIMGNLRSLNERLPTQTKRTVEQEEFQQFSTPHPYAFAMAWAANVSAKDVVLEPSAGTGNLAVFARQSGAQVVVNELSEYRANLLAAQGYVRLFRENAEQLNNILPAEIRPTVVVMNPPFSATAGRMEGKRDTMIGAQHVEQALKRLEPGGRLVALVGHGMAMDRPAFRSWWERIKREYTVRANLGIEGKGYAKFGTSFDNQLLVIDKTGPTTEDVLTGQVSDITEVIPLLAEVRNARTHPGEHFTDQQGREAVAGEGSVRARPGPALLPATDEVGARTEGGRPAAEEPAGRTGDVAETAGSAAGRGAEVSDRGRGGRRAPGRAGDIDAEPQGRGPGAAQRAAPEDVGDDQGVSAPVRSLSAIAKDAAGHGVKGIDESLKGLYELFGGKNLKSFPGGLDEEAYAKAKPHFEKALQEFIAAGRDVKDFIRFIIENFGKGVKPYLVRFMDEYKGKPTKPDVSTESIEIQAAQQKAAKEQLTDNIYENYSPSISIAGAKPHPGTLVESAAMAAVRPPQVSYRPSLPKEVIEKGLLSDAQLEAVVLAGAAHGQTLPEGQRRGFFIGDGTGVGKGREISGIILDNWRQGRTKAVWISEKTELYHDARRDFSGVGGNADLIFNLSKINAEAPIKNEKGILYTTYATLKSKAQDVKDPGSGNLIREGKSRLQQIIDWLGPDFDGVLVFDESHNMGNNMEIDTGVFGRKKATQTAIAGIELQAKLPNARVLYVSATGATEVHNFGYADRLGLWGKGTPFASKQDFVNKVSAGGIAAMELVAMNMKAMGSYIARSLSYAEVTYGLIEHPLTPAQLEVYNELVRAWQVVLQNLNKVLEITGIVGQTKTGQTKTLNGRAKAMASSKFWSAHQRFFNQVLTAMQTPAIIASIEQETAKGNVTVLQLVNTNEAAQERAAARLEQEERDLEDLDITPREALMQYVQAGFPTMQYEEYTDDNGNTLSRPVLDSHGNPVENREAVVMRDALLMKLGALKVPDNPIDMIISHFGPERVAEVTGRKRRFVRIDGKMTEQKLGPAKALADARAFMDDKKDILIFSDKGGTGRSYHADLTAKNQKRRIHYLVQPGWRADKALQGFGRTHRTNQASAPHYALVTTNLKAQRRFLSSVARRLDQLGALTRGQRQAGSQGIFTAEYNLETKYAEIALYNLIQDLNARKVEGLDLSVFEQQMGINLRDKDGNLTQKEIPTIPKFLNRLLSLDTSLMDKVFDAFFERLESTVEHARADGTLDVGLENVIADSIVKEHEETVHQDVSGAETRYVKLRLEDKVQPMTFEKLMEFSFATNNPVLFFGKNKRSGHVYAFLKARDRTDKTGAIQSRYRRIGPLSSEMVDAGETGDPDSSTFKSKYEHITDLAKAKEAWEADIQSAPKTKVHERHLVTGAVLPIWDRLAGDPRIVRVQTDAGERLIGRLIPEKYLRETLKKLGAEGAKIKLTPAQMVEQIMTGATVELANGWRLQARTVSNEDRIEISGPSHTDMAALEKEGVFAERIGWQTRFFIPTGAQAAEVLSNVIQYRPVVSVGDKGLLVQQRAREYTVEANEGDPYEHIETREGTTVRQKEAGRAALRDVQRAALYHRRALEAKVLGSSIPADFIERASASLVGQTANSPEELATIAQVLRDPRFETFRVFYTKEGRIVGHTSLTSRLPGAVNIVAPLPGETLAQASARFKNLIESKKTRLQADGYWLLHNHPFGTAQPSKADVLVTIWLANRISGFLGHVVLDHDQYGLISIDSGSGLTVRLRHRKLPAPFDIDKPEIAHEWLRRVISNSEDLRGLASTARLKDGFMVVAALTAGRTISGVAEFPVSLFTSMAKIDRLRAIAHLQRFARQEGGYDLVAIAQPQDLHALAWLVSSGRMADIVDIRSGATLLESGVKLSPAHVSDLWERQSGRTSVWSVEANRSGPFRFTDPATEKRYQEARAGMSDPRSLIGRVKDWIEHVYHGFSRHYINLPKAPEFSKAEDMLRRFEAAPQAAKEKSVAMLRQITEGLTPEEYDLFTRKVILDDLEYEDSLEHELPFGFTSESLATDKKAVDAAVEASPKIQQALQTRKRHIDSVTARLVEAGILSEEQTKNPAYFRHQVLTYARLQQLTQGARKLKKPRPGYARRRKGSIEDINANYIEAEFEFLHRALVDIRAVETINAIDRDYSIKKELMKEAKERGIDWRTLVPEGYRIWQPEKGNHFYVGHTIGERAIEEVLDALRQQKWTGVDAGALRDVAKSINDALIVGSRKRELVVPEVLADTLDMMKPDVDSGLFDHALATPLAMWKQWVLINPRRVLRYNLNNLSGDLDAVIAGAPKALKKLPEAIQILWNVMHGQKAPREYWDAMDRGVFDSGLTINEIPEINFLRKFDKLVGPPGPKQMPGWVAMKIWRTLKDYTQFRENWMRFAAYLHYLEELEAGKSMNEIGYGASLPKMVDEITDSKDRAALLARDMVGDYGAISHFGQGIRKKVIPFYSWWEINTKRYVRLIRNAFDQGVLEGARMTGIVGASLGTRITAWLFVRMALLYVTVMLYNNLVHGDEEDELSDFDRIRLHLNLGRDKNGEVRLIRFQGAFSDFLAWFGFEDAVGVLLEIEKGRAGWSDVAKTVGKAPINKVVSGITPIIKTPLELAAGRSFYPDVFKPRVIRDRPREIARLFSLDPEYDWLTGNPTRGYLRTISPGGLVIDRRNAGEMAYNRIMELQREFTRSKGIEGTSDITTPKSRLIRQYVRAKRFGDKAAEERFLLELQQMGVKPLDLNQSIRRMRPMSGLSLKDRRAFYQTLNADERDMLNRADQYYRQTFVGQ